MLDGSYRRSHLNDSYAVLYLQLSISFTKAMPVYKH